MYTTLTATTPPLALAFVHRIAVANDNSFCLIAIPFFVGMTMGWGRRQS